jgi:hypothetical protein
MSIRKSIAALVATSAVATSAFVGLASPAHAGPGDTATTFILTGGALSVSAPASKALGTAATGSGSAAISTQLGTTTVTDARGALLVAWTSSVASTDFTTGGATANETITKTNLDYWSGAATTATGVGTFTPGQLLVANKQTLASSRTAFSAATVVGNNTVIWNPTVDVNVPSAAVVGTYSGTITHSVA